ncbi:MAG: nuclear transport factor 2 family protein [Spirochaetaceae bacterium]|nr:nuclear transport factor 2 family protein [Spirochaetaceae bacterium]HPG26519.1 nuclear transport factor 2 family protein [Myxococcota bacterium]
MDLAELLAIEEIKRLKYRYMRCVDMKLWDEMATVFVPEATCAYSAGHYAYEGRDAIIEWLRKGMDKPGFHSTHSVHQPEIELVGDAATADRATGTWKIEDIVVDVDYDIMISGAAFYHDRYVKREGRWWIEHTGYDRIWEQLESRKDRPSLKLTASMWTSGGRSAIEA